MDIFEQGTIGIGCNYWASNAGTAMWREWDETVIRKDLKTLAENGFTILRMFPNWEDFQTVRNHYAFNNVRDIRSGEDAREGYHDDCLTPLMINRFRKFCEIAEENGIHLIVGILTGWMSGRTFVPRNLERLNLLTDPEAIQWEVRFIRAFVKRVKDCKAIAAWDLGNECNCLGNAGSESAAWCWTHAVSSAIRLADPGRKVVSGMHSLRVEIQNTWHIRQQAEFNDVLTTHPYPLFTPYCNLSDFNEVPTTLHATAESCLSADISGKICIVEEAGSLGPQTCSDERDSKNARTNVFSVWAHDLRHYLRWCAFDLSFTSTPYDWIAMERELGVFNGNYEMKKVGIEISKAKKRIDALKIDHLPPRKTEAVCIMTHEQDSWLAAYGAFVTAKEAGFELKFTVFDEELPDSRLYLMPSIASYSSYFKHSYLKLMEKVKDGATLLVTCDNGQLQPFEELFGCYVDSRYQNPNVSTFQFQGREYSCNTALRKTLCAGTSHVLAYDSTGNPVFTEKTYGKGRLLFLDLPIENDAIKTKSHFGDLYRFVYETTIGPLPRKSAAVGVTHHGSGRDEMMILINYGSAEGRFELEEPRLNAETGVILSGEIAIPGNDAVILKKV